MNIQRNLLRNTFATVLGVLMACGMANSQPGTGPFAAFPTQSVKDGRFLGFACAGLATMEQSVRIDLTAPAATTTFNIDVFDGDTGGADGSGKMHWDLGTRQLKLSLYADPQRTGNPVPVNLIGTWYGNAANATSGPLWSSSAAAMPDNDWWALTVTTSAMAQAPSGNYFYALVIETDGACSPGEQSDSSLKLATSNAVTFSVPNFGLVASLRQVFNDVPILYPGSTITAPATGSFLSAPTTYDGTFELFFPVAAGETELRLFDGDFDFGTGSLLGVPSGVSLDACADTDDPGTSASYDDFPFDTTGARAEGVQGAGVPPEDNNFDAFRRGELSDPNGIGCVRYELSDPEGHTYFNDNPSGDLEWEQFMVASTSSPLIGDADWVYTGETVPAGIWKVNIVGLDLSNLNCWHTTACATTASRETLPDEDPDDVPRIAACPDDSVSLVGSFVWEDKYNLGVMDTEEPGIPGVLMELVRSRDGAVVATTRTGDPESPNWQACLANVGNHNTDGLYCFGVNAPNTYQARVAESNFEPGQPLESRVLTTAEVIAKHPTRGNGLNYNFGYYRAPHPKY